MTDSKPSSAGAIAGDWWRTLNPASGVQTGPHRAALARLRRAQTPLDAIGEAATLRLIQRLPHFDPDRVAALAAILAWVREEDDGRSVASAIGRKSLDDTDALMSEGRFRRLMQVERTGEELMEAMRRLIVLANGKVDVRDLSNSVLYWGDRVKKRWIFGYYGALQAAPTTSSTAPQGDANT